MTDQEMNQEPTTPENEPAKFGADQSQEPEAKFGKDDIDKLLKQNFHGQEHIKTLEQETASLRQQLNELKEQLATSKSIDDLISEMRNERGNEENHQPGPTTPQVDKEQLLNELRTRVFEDLSAVEQANLQQKNWQDSVNLLKERHGDGYAKYVDDRAEELQMDVKQLEELAKTSPKAFMELVSPGTKSTVSPTQTTTRGMFQGQPDIEVQYRQVATLRKNLRSEEGRKANALWNDPDFQKQYRMHILKKFRGE